MIPIIIMNHGLFGKELIATAEMVVGKLEEVQAVSLMPGMTLEDYLEQSEVAVNQAGGKAIVLTDRSLWRNTLQCGYDAQTEI